MMRAVLTLLAAAICSIGHIQADPVTYTLSTTATGTLGSSTFTDALVTVTMTGDTADVMTGPVRRRLLTLWSIQEPRRLALMVLGQALLLTRSTSCPL